MTSRRNARRLIGHGRARLVEGGVRLDYTPPGLIGSNGGETANYKAVIEHRCVACGEVQGVKHQFFFFG